MKKACKQKKLGYLQHSLYDKLAYVCCINNIYSNFIQTLSTLNHPTNRRLSAFKLSFKNNAPLISCISKIDNTLIDNAEDLDIVMPMYTLIEYSKNYSKTSGTFWNYYRDEPNSGLGGANNNINYSIKNSKSFD